MDRDMGSRGSRAVSRGVLSVLSVAVVLTVALMCPRKVAGKEDLQQRLAALRAAGHPTSLAELAEREKIPAGARNAAEIYEAAFDALVYPDNAEDVPILGKAELPDLGRPLSKTMAEAIDRKKHVADSE